MSCKFSLRLETKQDETAHRKFHQKPKLILKAYIEDCTTYLTPDLCTKLLKFCSFVSQIQKTWNIAHEVYWPLLWCSKSHSMALIYDTSHMLYSSFKSVLPVVEYSIDCVSYSLSISYIKYLHNSVVYNYEVNRCFWYKINFMRLLPLLARVTFLHVVNSRDKASKMWGMIFK